MGCEKALTTKNFENSDLKSITTVNVEFWNLALRVLLNEHNFAATVALLVYCYRRIGQQSLETITRLLIYVIAYFESSLVSEKFEKLSEISVFT